MDDFDQRNQERIRDMSQDAAFRDLSARWFLASFQHEYSYHFRWLGLPIIQYPQDIVALQEIIWQTKPDLIIETGVARGGSLIFYASMLALLGGPGRVIGIDVDIRPHNRRNIEAHPLAERVVLVQGSSVDEAVVRQVSDFARVARRVMVVLDSNHTHEHVLRELEMYSPLVTAGHYLVVLDTVVADMPAEFFPN